MNLYDLRANTTPRTKSLFGRAPRRILATSWFLSVIICGLLPAHAASESDVPDLRPGGRSFGELYLPRRGKTIQYSSQSSTPGAADSWRVSPGESVTLVDHKGAGVIRRWWMTDLQHETNPQILRHIIIRCYWDGERDPSVESPLADFFGLSFGEWRDYVSMPASVTSGGFNCSWPMPFHSSARITVENASSAPITDLYFNIEVETASSIPNSSLYFHAQFRRVARAVKGRPVVVLETTGSGHYVGTVLSARTLRGTGLRFLEGNESFFVDGEEHPSVSGTGTEDYFNAGLYFVTGAFAGPYHGATVVDPGHNRVGAYRWHIEDPIAFSKSLRFELQHGPSNNVPAEYTTLAIWYQTHPHPRFPSFPEDLGPTESPPPYKIDGVVEGESLVARVLTTAGQVYVQSMAEFDGAWSGDAQLLWRGARPGDHLSIFIDAPEGGEYELVGYFTRSSDYGNVRILHLGKELYEIHGFQSDIAASGPVVLGRVHLERGTNALLLEISGKDPKSGGYAFGFDCLRLEPK
jgi:hypothetical protein